MIYINDLPNSIHCAARLFADDTCLIVKAPTINETEAELNSELNKVSAWMLANKLTLNPAKSNVLIINPKLTSTTPKLEITCPNGLILSTTKPKYLGVIIDDKLNFSEHVKLIETKVARAVGIVGKLNYYIPQKALLTLYYSLIHPYLLYGLVAWGNTFPTYLDRLGKLQNKAIGIIHGSNCNLSTSLLYCKFDVLPFNKLIKFEIAKFVHEQINKLPSKFNNCFVKTSCLHDRVTRFAINEQLHIPFYKTKRTQFTIKFMGAKVWNLIPITVRNLVISKFKKQYKNLLLNKVAQVKIS